MEKKLIDKKLASAGSALHINKFTKRDIKCPSKYINAFTSSEELSKNIAMQVAAMNPIALNQDGVSKDIIEKEIEIAKEQLRAEGKPEAMLDNIAKGKLKKFFKESTLINQAYIKDNKSSVYDYVKSVNQDCEITDFKRVALV